MFGLRIFYFFRDFVPIGFILDFIQNICSFNSLQVFSRYSSRLYSLDIISITIPDFASDFRLVFFLFSRLVFTRINFDLFQHCRFYALTLQLFISLTLLLVINKHLCLNEFVYAYFGYFKAS